MGRTQEAHLATLQEPTRLNYQSGWANGLQLCWVARRASHAINEVRAHDRLRIEDSGSGVLEQTQGLVPQQQVHGINCWHHDLAASGMRVRMGSDELTRDHAVPFFTFGVLARITAFPSSGFGNFISKSNGDAGTTGRSWEFGITDRKAPRFFYQNEAFDGFPQTLTGVSDGIPVDNLFHWYSFHKFNLTTAKFMVDGIQIGGNLATQNGNLKENFGQQVTMFAARDGVAAPLDFFAGGEIAAILIWNHPSLEAVFDDGEILSLFGPGGGGGLDDLFTPPDTAIDDLFNPSPTPEVEILEANPMQGEGTLDPDNQAELLIGHMLEADPILGVGELDPDDVVDLVVFHLLEPDDLDGVGLLNSPDLIIDALLEPNDLVGVGLLNSPDIQVGGPMFPNNLEGFGLLDPDQTAVLLMTGILEANDMDGVGRLDPLGVADLKLLKFLEANPLQGVGVLDPDDTANLVILEILEANAVEGVGQLSGVLSLQFLLSPNPLQGFGLLDPDQQVALRRDILLNANPLQGVGLLDPDNAAEFRVIQKPRPAERVISEFVTPTFYPGGKRLGPKHVVHQEYRHHGFLRLTGDEQHDDVLVISALPPNEQVISMTLAIENLSNSGGTLQLGLGEYERFGIPREAQAFFKNIPLNIPVLKTVTDDFQAAAEELPVPRDIIVSFVGPSPDLTIIFNVNTRIDLRFITLRNIVGNF